MIALSARHPSARVQQAPWPSRACHERHCSVRAPGPRRPCTVTTRRTVQAVKASKEPAADVAPTSTQKGASPEPPLSLDALLKLTPDQVDAEIAKRSLQARSMRAGVKGNVKPILISDVISETEDGTIQWVQLVMAGGGMLGIAHVGFVRALEEAGIRFLGLGGTSAGAINAALVAALRKDPTDTSWKETFEVMKECRFDSFEDGDPYFQELRKKMLPGTKDAPGAGAPPAPGVPATGGGGLLAGLSQGVASIFQGIASIPKELACTALKKVVSVILARLNLRQEVVDELWEGLKRTDKFVDVWNGMGVHRGVTFRRWLSVVMYSHGLETTGQLLARMQLPHGVKVYRRKFNSKGRMIAKSNMTRTLRKLLSPEHRDKWGQPDLPLKLVASEITTQTMVVFPEDADLFYEPVSGQSGASAMDDAPPADFVRASMSVPLFFRPFKLPAPTIYPTLGLDCTRLYDQAGERLLGADGLPLCCAPIIGSDGKPVLGEDGRPIMAADGAAIFGKGGTHVKKSDGTQLLGADGKPVLRRRLLSCNGKPALGENGDEIVLADLAPHGVASLGPTSEPVLDAAGKPVLGADQEPLFAAPIVTPDGKPLLDKDGNQVLAADGEALFGNGGTEVLDRDGARVYGADGQPIKRIPVLGADGKQVMGPGGQPIELADLRLKKLPDAGKNICSWRWRKRNGFAGKVPRVATFVDGGTLSNFPIALFHADDRQPLMPTLGVQLGADRDSAPPIRNPVQMYASMNNTSRHLMDREFLLHNLDYQKLVATVDTNGFDWLDFTMTTLKQKQLFLRGMEAAVLFLERWRTSSGAVAQSQPGAVAHSQPGEYRTLYAASAGMDRASEAKKGASMWELYKDLRKIKAEMKGLGNDANSG